MSQLFAWGGQSIGVSASASVLPVNTQDWSPSGWTTQPEIRQTFFFNDYVRKVSFLALLDRWGNWGTTRFKNARFRITTLDCETRIQTQAVWLWRPVVSCGYWNKHKLFDLTQQKQILSQFQRLEFWYQDTGRTMLPPRHLGEDPSYLLQRPVLSCFSCVWLCNAIGCSPSGSVHGILQARLLERVAMPFSGGSSPPRDQTRVSCITDGLFTTEPPGKPPQLPVVPVKL